jgi:hypothetical protein
MNRRTVARLARIPPLRQLPRDLRRFEVDLERVADLSSRERLERVDPPLPVPDRRQWASFQAVGEALFAEDWAGITHPAAARPGGLAR